VACELSPHTCNTIENIYNDISTANAQEMLKTKKHHKILYIVGIIFTIPFKTLTAYKSTNSTNKPSNIKMHNVQLEMQLLYTEHPYNGLFPRIKWVNQYQKDETILDFNEARDEKVLRQQGHWLDHMQRICTLLPHHHAHKKDTLHKHVI